MLIVHWKRNSSAFALLESIIMFMASFIEKNIIKFQFSEIFELAKLLQFLRLITLLAQNQKMNLIEQEISYIQMLDSFLRQQNIQSASKEN